VEGAATAVQEVCRADRAPENQRSGHDRACPGTPRLRLGHRRKYRKATPVAEGGLVSNEVLPDSSADDSRGPTKRRSLEENYAVRSPDPTRAFSPRQLPTYHLTAVSTRAYQCDQSSRMLLGCYRHSCPEVFPFAFEAQHTWRTVSVKDSRCRAPRVLDRPRSPPKLLRSSKRKEKQTRSPANLGGLTGSLHISSPSVFPHDRRRKFELSLCGTQV
jgi:hypothetical protein